jgi:alkanesulfonate monooxygenase SsuD/methylene tetrahydromethanopterin reductase-like flavin-dependent oxidoreductase (luciferase family)
MIKPWIFEFFAAPGGPGVDVTPQAATAHYNWYLDLWQKAEGLGFEGIFFSEHHFGPGYSPSPNLLIATLAPRTRTLRLGVMGMVLPYYEPWRVVEEIAMLDHLTGGRLEIGTSAGIPNEMAMVGLSVAEARARNDEAIEIIDAALLAGTVTHKGKYWSFENLPIVPRPLQRPSPPRWTTVLSIESARKAARRGSRITTSFHSVARVRAIFDAYREEAERAGNPAGPEQLGLRRTVTIAARETVAQEAGAVTAKVLDSVLANDPRVTREPVPDAPGPSHSFAVSGEELITGDPAHVADQIVAQCSAVGAGHFLGIINMVAPKPAILEGHLLFGSEVIPALRRASV